jgi:hypothetical protein
VIGFDNDHIFRVNFMKNKMLTATLTTIFAIAIAFPFSAHGGGCGCGCGKSSPTGL